MSIQVEPQALIFADDGSIPNNPRLPFLVYRNAIDLSGTPDPEAVVEKTFARHGWGEMWRNGIYPYVHYHSKIHEALGIARGRARVRFGGVGGEVLDPRLATSRCFPPAPATMPVGGARALRGGRLSEERKPRPAAAARPSAKALTSIPRRAAAGYRSGARQGRAAQPLWRF
jgi:hypothetical protein